MVTFRIALVRSLADGQIMAVSDVFGADDPTLSLVLKTLQFPD